MMSTQAAGTMFGRGLYFAENLGLIVAFASGSVLPLVFSSSFAVVLVYD